jgi:methionyl-tRNA formyltransferase
VPIVVTQPDRRRGRGTAVDPTPVKVAAVRLGLTVVTPNRAIEIADQLAAASVDFALVVAFGQLLPRKLLDVLPDRFVNVHYSLLPRWRGAAPVERAMLAGDAETGVCLMRIEAGLDTGPVFARAATPITDVTAGELRERLTALGVELLLARVGELFASEPEPQADGATHAAKLTVEEFQLDPVVNDAATLLRLVRAGNPRPGAWLIVDGGRVKVWDAEVRRATEAGAPAPETGTLTPAGDLGTRAGTLRLLEVQPEGKRRMVFTAWRAGHRGSLVLT